MCGITGWVDYERDLSAQHSVIAAMTATMACRGPDAGGTWCSPRAAIGHRRLAVIDIEGGAQPMRAPRAADVVLSFSGEIYNFRELRTELEGYGHDFRTRSDTEVLLHAWLQWGDGCLPRLNGMFAFAVWDGAREELVLARDRLGIKPLYYAPRPAGVLFGSEPKAILAHPEFRAELDAEGVAELFSQAGHPEPGQRVYRGMAEVRPGWSVRISRGGICTSPYWQLEVLPHTDDLDTTVGTVRELLADIVGRQVVADVPLGSLLSGGLDSSVLSALAARALDRDNRGKLVTFSVDFPGSEAAFRPDRLRPSHDEPYARRAAEHIGSRHSTIMLDAATSRSAAGRRCWRTTCRPWATCTRPCTCCFGSCASTAPWPCPANPRTRSSAGTRGITATPCWPGPATRGRRARSWAGLLRPEVASRVRLDEYAADGYAQAAAEVPWLAGEDERERAGPRDPLPRADPLAAVPAGPQGPAEHGRRPRGPGARSATTGWSSTPGTCPGR